MHCEPIAGALLARGSWTPRAPPQVRQEAGKTLAKLDHAATDAVVEHISGADGFAKLGWAQGRQELGPEAARSRAAPCASQGPSAGGLAS